MTDAPVLRAEPRLRRSYLVALGLMSLAAFSVGPGGLSHVLRDPDVYWHLATGDFIWRTLSLPLQDPFSHTVRGKEWVQHEWAADVILSAVYYLSGWPGLIVLTLSSAVLAIVLLARFLWRYLSGPQVLIAGVLASFLMLGHVLARPHALMWPILVLWVGVLVRAADEDRPPPLWGALLMLVWANLHGSFVLGLGILGVLACEAVATNWGRDGTPRTARAWIGFAALASGAALLTPDGLGNILHIVELQSQKVMLSRIGEWQPPDFRHFEPLELWLFMLLATTWHWGVRFGPFRIALVLGLVHMALTHVRHAELLGLIGPMLLAAGLARHLPKSSSDDRLDQWLRRRHRTLIAAAAVAGSIFIGVVAAGPWRPDDRISPRAALGAVRAAGVAGHVFNDYDFGGFLIAQGVPTFIDGRADLYGDAFVSRYFELVDDPSVDRMRALFDAYGVTWTLLRGDSSLAKLLDNAPGWERLYADDIAVVHRRKASPDQAP